MNVLPCVKYQMHLPLLNVELFNTQKHIWFIFKQFSSSNELDDDIISYLREGEHLISLVLNSHNKHFIQDNCSYPWVSLRPEADLPNWLKGEPLSWYRLSQTERRVDQSYLTNSSNYIHSVVHLIS
jgi:hypothetical protein